MSWKRFALHITKQLIWESTSHWLTSHDVFVGVNLNKLLEKESSWWWFVTSLCSCDVNSKDIGYHDGLNSDTVRTVKYAREFYGIFCCHHIDSKNYLRVIFTAGPTAVYITMLNHVIASSTSYLKFENGQWCSDVYNVNAHMLANTHKLHTDNYYYID